MYILNIYILLNSHYTEVKERSLMDQPLIHIPQDVKTSLYSVLSHLSLRSSSQCFNTGNKNFNGSRRF